MTTTRGRLFTDSAGNAFPQHRWTLIEVDADGNPDDAGPLVEFVGPEPFWAHEAGKWEQQASDRLFIRPDRLAWLRDGEPYASLEVSSDRSSVFRVTA